jgi:hypothetical protein
MLIPVLIGWIGLSMSAAARVSTDDVSLKFLPSETVGIAFIDFAELRTVPLLQDFFKNQTGMTFPRGLDEFTKATGIKVEDDVDKVTAARIGAREELLIVQGRIDKLKVEEYLKGRSGPNEVHLGHNIYLEKDTAITAFDNLILIGSLNTIKTALDHRQLPGSAPLRRELMTAIDTIEAGNQIWAVGELSNEGLETLGVFSPGMEILKGIKRGTYQMRVDTGVHARATAEFLDPESANNLADTVRGVLAIAKSRVDRQQPEMLQLLNGIQISNTSTTLTITIEEPGELLKKLQERYQPSVGRKLD